MNNGQWAMGNGEWRMNNVRQAFSLCVDFMRRYRTHRDNTSIAASRVLEVWGDWAAAFVVQCRVLLPPLPLIKEVCGWCVGIRSAGECKTIFIRHAV